MKDLPADIAGKINTHLKQELCAFNQTANGDIHSATVGNNLKLKMDDSTVRFSNGDSWFGLRLFSYGRADSLRRVAAPTLIPSGNRLDMEYAGLTQWYVNHGDNMEHGLVLDEKPAGSGALRFHFATSGNMTPTKSGEDILFVGANDINYSGLKAWDADGTILTCSMDMDGEELVWNIQDADARYPVTVDPIVSPNVVTLDPDDLPAGSNYAYTVALSEDTVLVNASAEDSADGTVDSAGAVYVFSKDEGGPDNWGYSQKLMAPTPVERSFFGAVLDISGDDAVIAPINENSACVVYVYARNAEGAWELNANYGDNGRIEFSTFYTGGSVGAAAIFGDTVVVGCPGEYGNLSTIATGAVYVFTAGVTGIQRLANYEYSSDARMSAHFGSSIDLSGDTLVVGAPGMYSFTGPDRPEAQGEAYVYSRVVDEGATYWTLAKTIPGVTTSADFDYSKDSEFGTSVSVYGDTIIVGAPGNTGLSTNTTVGAAYVFSKDTGGTDNWGLDQRLAPQTTDGATYEYSRHFGQRVSIYDDTAVVGADALGSDTVPRVYVFSTSASSAPLLGPGITSETRSGTWGVADIIKAPASGYSVSYGKAIGICGDHVIVNDYGFYSGDTEAAYLYTLLEQTYEVSLTDISVDPTSTDAALTTTYNVTFGTVESRSASPYPLLFHPLDALGPSEAGTTFDGDVNGDVSLVYSQDMISAQLPGMYYQTFQIDGDSSTMFYFNIPFSRQDESDVVLRADALAGVNITMSGTDWENLDSLTKTVTTVTTNQDVVPPFTPSVDTLATAVLRSFIFETVGDIASGKVTWTGAPYAAVSCLDPDLTRTTCAASVVYMTQAVAEDDAKAMAEAIIAQSADAGLRQQVSVVLEGTDVAYSVIQLIPGLGFFADELPDLTTDPLTAGWSVIKTQDVAFSSGTTVVGLTESGKYIFVTAASLPQATGGVVPTGALNLLLLSE